MIEPVFSDERIKTLLYPLTSQIQIIGKTLVIHSMNAVQLVPKICSLLQENKVVYGNIRLRGNTLRMYSFT